MNYIADSWDDEGESSKSETKCIDESMFHFNHWALCQCPNCDGYTWDHDFIELKEKLMMQFIMGNEIETDPINAKYPIWTELLDNQPWTDKREEFKYRTWAWLESNKAYKSLHNYKEQLAINGNKDVLSIPFGENGKNNPEQINITSLIDEVKLEIARCSETRKSNISRVLQLTISNLVDTQYLAIPSEDNFNKDEQLKILAAELYRELGEFDSCLKVLSECTIFENQYVKMIHQEASKNNEDVTYF
jgi:hypothetical protein